jgi:hypothetical protein
MDIRLVRGRRPRVWLWSGLLAGAGILVLVVTVVFGGDRTMETARGVGADANFGAERAEVLPMEAEPFEDVLPLDNRELGRLVHLRAAVESPVRGGAVWVRATTGHRLLVRFDPPPGAGFSLGPGSRLQVNGYLHKLSRAEFDLWTDTLGVAIPRPRPGVKFGDVPDTAFAKVDALFIRDFFILVRPEGLRPTRSTAELRPGADPARPEAEREETGAADAGAR